MLSWLIAIAGKARRQCSSAILHGGRHGHTIYEGHNASLRVRTEKNKNNGRFKMVIILLYDPRNTSTSAWLCSQIYSVTRPETVMSVLNPTGSLIHSHIYRRWPLLACKPLVIMPGDCLVPRR